MAGSGGLWAAVMSFLPLAATAPAAPHSFNLLPGPVPSLLFFALLPTSLFVLSSLLSFLLLLLSLPVLAFVSVTVLGTLG